jgi:L-ribulose-5-phosphate 3-epimerase
MKLWQQWRLGIYEKALPNHLDWTERLTEAKGAGYDFMELSIDESDARIARLDWSQQEMEQVLWASRQADLPIESICFSAQRRFPLGSGLPGAEEQALQLLAKAVRLAAFMGIRIIQLQGYDCYYVEVSSAATKERFLRNLRKGVAYAASYGVTLALETMENDFMNTIQKAMYYVEEINSPYLQVYPDIGNISNATQYVCQDIRTGKGHIAAAHLKETVPGKYREIPYGTGQVAFPFAIRTLYDQGVRRYVAEFWHLGEENWKEIARENRLFLQEQFEAAMKL